MVWLSVVLVLVLGNSFHVHASLKREEAAQCKRDEKLKFHLKTRAIGLCGIDWVAVMKYRHELGHSLAMTVSTSKLNTFYIL